MLFNIVYRYTSMEGGTDGARATVLRRRRLRRRLLLTARRTTAADCSGRPLDVHPDLGLLFYNTACCESLAGHPDQAVAHLARAIELWNGCAVWRRRVLRDCYASSAREEAASRSASSTPRPSGGRGGRRRRNGSGTRGRTRCESSGSTRTSSGLMRGRSSTQAPTPLAAGVIPPLSAGKHHRATPRPRESTVAADAERALGRSHRGEARQSASPGRPPGCRGRSR